MFAFTWKDRSLGALLTVALFFAIAACGFAHRAMSAPPGSNIVIKYGKNVSEKEIQRVVRKLESGHISVKAEPGLESDNCSAVVMNDIEIFRYNEKSTYGWKLVTTIQLLVGGRRMHRQLQSDCLD